MNNVDKTDHEAGHCGGTAGTLVLTGRQKDQKFKTSPGYVPKKGGKRGGRRRGKKKGKKEEERRD